jgi:hypothetical protein
LKGDYRGLFTWLDKMETEECGNNIGVFIRDFPSDKMNDIATLLKEEISGAVKLDPSDRIYVFMENENGDLRGRFLFGMRKRAPWEGFAGKPADESAEF